MANFISSLNSSPTAPSFPTFDRVVEPSLAPLRSSPLPRKFYDKLWTPFRLLAEHAEWGKSYWLTGANEAPHSCSLAERAHDKHAHAHLVWLRT